MNELFQLSLLLYEIITSGLLCDEVILFDTRADASLDAAHVARDYGRSSPNGVCQVSLLDGFVR